MRYKLKPEQKGVKVLAFEQELFLLIISKWVLWLLTFLKN